jgi:multisubunit Na+/H+ antiporter MnhC subunit
MSLKAFHLIFIIVSIALAVGFGVWLIAQGGWMNVILGVISFGVGVGLVFYERYFLKKTKNISYL